MVAIKDVEMPSCCCDCPLCIFDYWDGNMCKALNISIEEYKDMEKHPDCPLVEIEVEKIKE